MTHFLKLTAMLVFLTLCGSSPALRAFDLLPQNPLDILPEIVLSEKASASSQLAARELADYYAKATGKTLATIRTIDPARPQIWVGLLREFENLPTKISARFQTARNEQGFYHLLQQNTLYIIGSQDPGQLYGVYAFLEEQLGIRWLKIPTLDDDGEYLPETPEKIQLTALDRYSEPDFIYRHFFQTGSYMSHYPQTSIEWCARVRLQGTGRACDHNAERVPPFLRHVTGGHGLYDIALGGNLRWPNLAIKQEFFKTRPDIFAMKDGQRFLSPEGMGRYCISNEYLQSLVVQEGLLLFKTHGVENATFQLGMGDYGSGWCECPECLRQNQVDKYQNDISTLFHNSMAEIAKKIYAVYPSATVLAASYASHHEVPRSGYHPDPRLLLEYCTHPRCYGHFLDDPGCARNAETLARIKRWQATGLRLVMREYDTCTPIQYCPLEEQTAYDLKLYRREGFVGYSTEAPFPDAQPVAKDPERIRNFQRFMPSSWQWMYLISRLTWDSTLDPQAILDEIEAKYYGRAYPVMKQYHAFRRRLWKNAPSCVGWPYVNPRAALLLNQPGSREKLLAWLDEAAAMAAGDPQLTIRIARDREYLNDFWITPNDKHRERGSNTFQVPVIEEPLTVDGKGSDPRWLRACYSTDFREAGNARTKIPEELATSVGILAGPEFLYVLFRCQEPALEKLHAAATARDEDVWQDDSCEIFIYPMNTDEKYYQLVINSRGTVFDSKNIPVDKKYDFKGLQVKTSLQDGAYLIEAAIPVRDIGPIQNGTAWKLHFARNRRGPANAGYSIDGEGYHVPVNYRTAVFGTPLLKNSTFDAVDGQSIRDWSSDQGGKTTATAVKTPSGYAARIVNGRLYQVLPLKSLPQERLLTFSFRTHGSGKLEVQFYHYADIPLEKPQNGQYTRRGFVRTVSSQSWLLTPQEQTFTFNYSLPANEYIALAFHAQDATIDDLCASLIPSGAQ